MRTIKTIIKNCKKLYIEIIWLRDEGVCQWCGEAGEQVHHIIPRSRSALLFYDLLNLILLCRGCHHKYGIDAAAGIRWFSTVFRVRWEYLHQVIKDEWGQELPRRNVIKSSWHKSDYLEIEERLKQKLGDLT